jgi:hypothetical protein
MGKNGRILFDRPKPTVGCSVSGRRRINNFNIILPSEMKVKLRLTREQAMKTQR